MRYTHSRITPTTVHNYSHQLLQNHLQWKAYKQSVNSTAIFNLVLMMASESISLFAASKRFQVSHETLRRALLSNLAGQPQLTQQLNNALYASMHLSAADLNKGWIVAIDTHNVPYYGDPNKANVCGSQKKQGTKYFFTYATAILITPGCRYTVGLIPIEPKTKPHQIVEKLLKIMDEHGLRIKGVILDCAFGSGHVLLMLQQRNYSYCIPLQRIGKSKHKRNQLFEKESGTIDRLDWNTDVGNKAVSTEVLVWYDKRNDEKKVFAFGGWTEDETLNVHQRAELARKHYRSRFGIETSYRQKNQCHAMTTTRNFDYRLLIEGLSHIIRQVWVYLTHLISQAWMEDQEKWVCKLPLRKLCDAIREALKVLFPNELDIDLNNPLDELDAPIRLC
jgi:Transposase DDE domain